MLDTMGGAEILIEAMYPEGVLTQLESLHSDLGDLDPEQVEPTGK